MTQGKSHPEVDWLFHKLRHTSAFSQEVPKPEPLNNEETEENKICEYLYCQNPEH